MIDSYEITARIRDAFGVAIPRPALRATHDGRRRVGVTHLPDWPDEGVTSWATVGACAFPTPDRTDEGLPICVEFVACVESRYDCVGDALATAAFEIGRPHDARPGTVYSDAIGVYAPHATTPHLLAVTPFLWHDFESYEDADMQVNWVQLVPITDAEARYCLDYGFEALEDHFLGTQPNLFTLDRPCTLDG